MGYPVYSKRTSFYIASHWNFSFLLGNTSERSCLVIHLADFLWGEDGQVKKEKQAGVGRQKKGGDATKGDPTDSGRRTIYFRNKQMRVAFFFGDSLGFKGAWVDGKYVRVIQTIFRGQSTSFPVPACWACFFAQNASPKVDSIGIWCWKISRCHDVHHIYEIDTGTI